MELWIRQDSVYDIVGYFCYIDKYSNIKYIKKTIIQMMLVM